MLKVKALSTDGVLHVSNDRFVHRRLHRVTVIIYVHDSVFHGDGRDTEIRHGLGLLKTHHMLRRKCGLRH